VRRVAPILFVLACCVLGAGLPGCSLFKKSDPPPPPPQNQLPPPKFPTGDPLNKSADAGPGGGTSILAGRVLDGNSRPPVNTSILVVRVDAKAEKTETDVPVSPDGYFTVNNLAQGASYKLVARGKTGDRMVAGINVVTAPNPRVMIQMREDLVTASTPPVPAPFDTLKEKRDPAFAKETPAAPTVAVLPPTNDPPAPANSGNTSWQPGNGGVNATVPAGGLPPVQVTVPGDGGPIAQMRGGLISLPTMEIGPPRAASIRPVEVPMPPTPSTLPSRPREGAVNLDRARVPSCVLVGNQLVNFALEDINGEPWELRTNRKGKLVLLDFWGTWCSHCKVAMPTLKGLQQQYGPAGLEVIGIAYENSGTREEQAHEVNDTCKRLLVNYRQLLGSGPNCVVKRELGVRAYPTMILIDERGNILWRHVGGLNDRERGELEGILQAKLRPAVY
jgi:thiol-disulfide isomerase/thioredoxin